MDLTVIRALAERHGAAFYEAVPLCGYTTMRIGGPCAAMLEPNSAACAAEALALCAAHGIPWTALGKGSNVLVCDEGIDRLVIRFGKALSAMRIEEGNILVCGAGASLADVCEYAYEQGLTGLEFAYGIPGTAGGGAFMNAGAYGGEMKDVVQSCEAADEQGRLLRFTREQLEFSYRHSVFSGGGFLVTEVCFQLAPGEREDIRARMDLLMQRRRDKQPLEYPSAGSTFKRPEGSYAALLIEQCGLKGLSVGGAQVSEKHSGFLINRTNATCGEMCALIDEVRARVEAETGYRLECELRIWK